MNSLYAVCITIVSLFSLLILAGDVFWISDPEQVAIIQIIDNILCVFFFADFAYLFYTAPNKTKYFFTWGWIDLLSSIPILDQFRIGKLVRIYRLLRVLRGLKAAKLVVQLIINRRADNIILAVCVCVILILSIGSMAILIFENVPESNIKTAEDAIWWTYVTITTVGYGDRYPVTTEGRILGAILMTVGVGLFGLFSGFVASWFIKPSETKQVIEIEDVHKELIELRKVVNLLTKSKNYYKIVRIKSRQV